VDIWRIILAQKSEPDHKLRRFYQQHAQGTIAYQQYQCRRFYGSVSSDHLYTTAAIFCWIFWYIDYWNWPTR